jgi:hypothetical protein
MGSIFDTICPPALIYLVFTLTQVIIDIYKKYYNVAITKSIQMVIFTLLLNILCQRGMSYLSWIIVLIPFIFMSFMTGLILYIFNLNDLESNVVDDADCKDYDYDNSCQNGDCDDELHKCNNNKDSDSDSDNDNDDENDNYIDDSLEEDGVEYSNTVYILPGQKAVRVNYNDLMVDKLYTNPSSSEYTS